MKMMKFKFNSGSINVYGIDKAERLVGKGMGKIIGEYVPNETDNGGCCFKFSEEDKKVIDEIETGGIRELPLDIDNFNYHDIDIEKISSEDVEELVDDKEIIDFGYDEFGGY